MIVKNEVRVFVGDWSSAERSALRRRPRVPWWLVGRERRREAAVAVVVAAFLRTADREREHDISGPSKHSKH